MTPGQLAALRIGAHMAARELEEELVRRGLIHGCLLTTALLFRYIPEAAITKGYQSVDGRYAYQHIWLTVDGVALDPCTTALKRLENVSFDGVLHETDPGLYRLDLETPEEQWEAQKVEQAIQYVMKNGVEAYLSKCPYTSRLETER
jgi:hypothetical protein